jgi:hypothetical protein
VLLSQFFTQWFDTAYPSGGGTNRPNGEDGSGVSQVTVPVSWLTATISPTALSKAWIWLAIDPVKPVGLAGSAKSLTAAKAVEPLLASWVNMPP